MTLKAHYDGKQIQLDEPFDLPPNCPLMVTVLPAAELLDERKEWSSLAASGLAGSYGPDEPDYTEADLKS